MVPLVELELRSPQHFLILFHEGRRFALKNLAGPGRFALHLREAAAVAGAAPRFWGSALAGA